MHGTRLLRSGPWSVAIAFALAGAILPRANLAQTPGPNVPRDALGAATPEYQQEALTKLMADRKAREIPEQFDPVILGRVRPGGQRH